MPCDLGRAHRGASSAFLAGGGRASRRETPMEGGSIPLAIGAITAVLVRVLGVGIALRRRPDDR